jgi:general secretion pathway protein A
MTKNKDGPPTTTDPFGKNITGRQLFKHRQLDELRSILIAAIQNRAMSLVTGPPGVGKTTAVCSVIDELPTHKYLPVYLGQDQSGVNAMRRLAHCLGIQPKVYRARLSMQISQWLLENLNAGGKEVVLIVDEAHLLDDCALQEFRLMTNANYDRESPLTVIFVGQPILRLRLKSPEFEALSQRLTYRYSLEGLDEDEAIEYMLGRLAGAGFPADAFTQEAIQFIFHHCQGVPRLINNLASLALLKAKAGKLQTIDLAFLKKLADLD